MSKDDGDDYEVGFGKPPKSGQFKKGQSGNPKGRPRDSKNLKTIMLRELSEKVTIKEGSKTRTLNRLEGIVKALTNSALHGKLGAIVKLLEMLERLQQTEATSAEPAPLSEADKELFDDFLLELAKGMLKREEDGGEDS